MTDPIRITSHGKIETVTLNRPDVLNAMDEPMIIALQGYFRALADRHEVRVVILNAEGRAFCAGLDLKGWAKREDEGAVHGGWRTQRAIATVMQLMRSCQQPIIACAQGAACGGGMSLLLASPMGLRLSKDVLNRNIDATGFEAALALEDRQQIMLSMTQDYAEARRAFAEKRAPEYRDR